MFFASLLLSHRRAWRTLSYDQRSGILVSSLSSDVRLWGTLMYDPRMIF